MLGIAVSLVGWALVAVLIGLGISATRPRSSGSGGVDARTVRQIFQYGVLFALVMVVAVGLSDLLARLFGAEPEQWQDDSFLLARALAFVLIGLPLLALVGWWVWRGHRTDPAETASPVFTGYLTLTALTSVVVTAVALQTLLFDAVDETRLNQQAAAQLVVWGAVWFGHWLLADRLLDAERNAAHLLLGSVLGLVVGGAGLLLTLGRSLDLLLRPDEVLRPIVILAEAGSVLIAWGLVWVRYWATAAIRLPRQSGWLAYVLLAGVAGGLVTAIVSASRLLWSGLVWVLGDRLDATWMAHFDDAAIELAGVAVGALVWWYHRALLKEAVAERGEVHRVYEYLVAGIALIAAATGVGTVLVALIEAVTPGVDIGMTTMNTLLAALTLLLVGVPVWWWHWRGVRAAVAAGPADEVAALPRRIYLVMLFGVAGVAAVIALLVAGYTFFRDLVDAQLGAATLRSMRYALGVLVASAAISAYHGAVFQADRGVLPVARLPGPRSVVLVGQDDPELARRLRNRTGARVEIWQLREGATPPAWDELAVLDALTGREGQNVLLISDGERLHVLQVDPPR